MVYEFLGVILVPICLIGIGFLYLFLAFKQEDYVQEKGCREYKRLYPKEGFCPHDSSFWAYQAIERSRKNKKEKY